MDFFFAILFQEAFVATTHTKKVLIRLPESHTTRDDGIIIIIISLHQAYNSVAQKL